MNTKKLAFAFNIVTLIPALVKLAEVFFGKGNGAEKKAAVVGAAGALIQIGGGMAAANNPAYADAIGQVVDATVSQLNASGQMPAPAEP